MIPAPPVAHDLTVVLVDDEVLRARRAVRRCLTEQRTKYARARRRGENLYVEQAIDRFGKYLELYGRLGGDVDEIVDIELTDTTAVQS